MSFGRNNFFDDRYDSNYVGENDLNSNSPMFGNDYFDKKIESLRNTSRRSPLNSFSLHDPFSGNQNYNRFSSPLFQNDNFASSSNVDKNFSYDNYDNQTGQKVYHIPIQVESNDDESNKEFSLLNETSPNNFNQNLINKNEDHHNVDNSKNHQNFNKSFANQYGQKNNYSYPATDSFNRSNSNFEGSEKNFDSYLAKVHPTQKEYHIPIHFESEKQEKNKLTNKCEVKKSTPGNKESYLKKNVVENKKGNNFNIPKQNVLIKEENCSDEVQDQNANRNNKKSIEDPMDLIDKIMEEVSKYEHEIDHFKGKYGDKHYRYLDEYLTRCMLKLDSIDTNNNQNLKQARKNALNYVNRIVSKLEKLENVNSNQNNDVCNENIEIKNQELQNVENQTVSTDETKTEKTKSTEENQNTEQQKDQHDENAGKNTNLENHEESNKKTSINNNEKSEGDLNNCEKINN